MWGYVAHKLLKKYEKEHDDSGKFAQYEMCLGNMAVFGDTSDFTKYTTEWLEKVNRRGLFPLNDTSFIFFVAIENVVCRTLPKQYIGNQRQDIKQRVLDSITSDHDVHYYQSFVSQDIDDEDASQELLYEIASLWVTIRDFSLASTWLEEYKCATKSTVAKNKRLRKELLGHEK